MPETTLTLVFHGITTGGIVVLLGISLHQHKVWVRMKDRLNDLWSDRCKAKGERFVPLENGSHD